MWTRRLAPGDKAHSRRCGNSGTLAMQRVLDVLGHYVHLTKLFLRSFTQSQPFVNILSVSSGLLCLVLFKNKQFLVSSLLWWNHWLKTRQSFADWGGGRNVLNMVERGGRRRSLCCCPWAVMPPLDNLSSDILLCKMNNLLSV